MTGARVLFYVQHLLGIGHLKRAATLVRALDGAGAAVTLVSGGPPVPGLDTGRARFVQLPPVTANDLAFKVLIDEAGREMDEALRRTRAEALVELVAETAPDAVITELYPFGRRQLRGEILAMLDAAAARTPRPLILSSVRDILVAPPKPERISETLEVIERLYDLVLVHGDPSVVPFERTFAPAARIARNVRYTGYVVDAVPTNAAAGAGEVIVSAGGGAVSQRLFEAAIAARHRTALADAPWRILAGPGLPRELFERLRSTAPAGVAVERARADFTSLLANCRLSLSQGGYNTMMELLVTGARAVVVPYAGGLETEQTLRARLLAADAGFVVVEEAELSVARIAEAVQAAIAGPPPGRPAIDLDGAATTARLVLDALGARRANAR